MKEEVGSWEENEILAQMEFNEKMRLREELSSTKTAIEAQLKELNLEIEAAMTTADVTKVKWEGNVVSIRSGRTASKIDGKLLVSKGVSLEVIGKCTIPGKSYTYVFVQKGKDEEGNSGDAA